MRLNTAQRQFLNDLANGPLLNAIHKTRVKKLPNRPDLTSLHYVSKGEMPEFNDDISDIGNE